MMKKLIIASMALSLLAGCTTLKRATGQIDDSTLPGQRAEILPPGQQVAPDPNVQGNQAVPPGGAISQAPVAPGQQVANGMPRANAPATANCDPKIDLCPEPLAPEPVAPISPVKPVVTKDTGKTLAKGTKPVTAVASTPAKTPPGTKPTTVKMASKPATTAADAANGNLAAGQVLTDPNAPADAAKTAGAATTDAAKKMAKKKIIKKKKKPADAAAAAPVDPNAPAAAPAPALPAAPAPQGQ